MDSMIKAIGVLRVWGRPVVDLDVVKYGVYAKYKDDAPRFGAPFGAVSWVSDDWDKPDNK